jgi:hypothetical protein
LLLVKQGEDWLPLREREPSTPFCFGIEFGSGLLMLVGTRRNKVDICNDGPTFCWSRFFFMKEKEYEGVGIGRKAKAQATGFPYRGDYGPGRRENTGESMWYLWF